MNASRPLPLAPWLLVVARVMLGFAFFFSDHGNGSGELVGFLTRASQRGFPGYRAFIGAVVLPHANVFGTLVETAEIAVGIALVLGVAARLSAGVAVFLLINYVCAKGALPFGPSIDYANIVLALIVLTCAGGRVVGFDQMLARRWPRVLLW